MLQLTILTFLVTGTSRTYEGQKGRKNSEISQNYVGGQLDNFNGSWKAGADDAQPGIVMSAKPEGGDTLCLACKVGRVFRA